MAKTYNGEGRCDGCGQHKGMGHYQGCWHPLWIPKLVASQPKAGTVAWHKLGGKIAQVMSSRADQWRYR